MTNPNLTYIGVVLDRSGSMASVCADTIGGFNSFLEKHRELAGEVRLSLAQFDNEYEVVHWNRNVHEIPKLTAATYQPRGGTALYDAIGTTVDRIGADLANLPEHERPGKVLILIVTDGEENASKRYRYANPVRDLIARQRTNYSWEFVFLGATEGGMLDAASLGVDQGSSLQYTPTAKGTRTAWGTVGQASVMYAASPIGSCLRSFTPEERAENAPAANP